jgi:pimeloyl-ACP methyl ester carboxylesterase
MAKSRSQGYTTGSVTSADGTMIGYRQLGHGPGVVLVHGAMQAAQSFMTLATALADRFTVYVPDRRGRGLSGPFGEDYGLDKECADLKAVLDKTGARNLFGLSAGAAISLHVATTRPDIEKLAVYEPPLLTGSSLRGEWLARYDRELAAGQLASALVTVINGIEISRALMMVPRFVLVPLMTLAIRADRMRTKGDDVSLETLIPTFRFDVKLVNEAQGALERFAAIRARVLLLGGSTSADYFRDGLDRLRKALPEAARVELAGLGHSAADNAGNPQRVAQELRAFFA